MAYIILQFANGRQCNLNHWGGSTKELFDEYDSQVVAIQVKDFVATQFLPERPRGECPLYGKVSGRFCLEALEVGACKQECRELEPPEHPDRRTRVSVDLVAQAFRLFLIHRITDQGQGSVAIEFDEQEEEIRLLDAQGAVCRTESY